MVWLVRIIAEAPIHHATGSLSHLRIEAHRRLVVTRLESQAGSERERRSRRRRQFYRAPTGLRAEQPTRIDNGGELKLQPDERLRAHLSVD
ncbi:hypothetical protein [Amycolatopsis sp. RTGN1]|uniref:hypothetical protein n=1 Tax=Amycolatopsis ponsaeliensis TaxID=2992142 RepID=UPI00254EDEBE|nr:hypothetical protein [Amycolatopsis sp. RTGN1]